MQFFQGVHLVFVNHALWFLYFYTLSLVCEEQEDLHNGRLLSLCTWCINASGTKLAAHIGLKVKKASLNF